MYQEFELNQLKFYRKNLNFELNFDLYIQHYYLSNQINIKF